MVRCKKCKKEIKDKTWPVENTGGLCSDCAYEDFLGKGSGNIKVVGGAQKNMVGHRDWMMFEKQLAVFLGEFDAAVAMADDEDRFLTPEELKQWEQKLQGIWEEHIKNTGQEKHLELFKQCYSCQHRNTPTDPLMTLGVIRCNNQECDERKKFNIMFNAVYTKKDIDRAKEYMDKVLKIPEDFTPDMSNISGETMEYNTDRKQEEHIEQREKEKDAKEMMYS